MEKKKMPLPKKKPRHANPKHPMNTEKTKPLGKAGGGKLKMVEKGGKKVPFFAADGKGKMAMGGMMKKKGYAKGGAVKVKSGDTLSQIAKSKGITLKSLLAANPSIKNANQIRVGQSIKMPNTRVRKGTPMSGNPYKGMTRSSMKALADDTAANRARLKGAKPSKARTAKSPDVAKKRATTTTRLNQLGETNRKQRAAEASAPRKEESNRAPRPRTDLKNVTSLENKRLAALRAKARKRVARRAGGGMMKKKGYAKGGMMKKGMAKGGVMRGTGAATKGKRFGRSG